MKIRSLLQPLCGVILFFVVVLSSIFMTERIDQDSYFLFNDNTEKFSLLWPENALRLACSGHYGTVSAYYYLSSLHYFGLHESTTKQYRWLAPLLQTTVHFDPHFYSAFFFGGILLPLEVKDVASGVELIQMAQKSYPKDWFFPFLEGYYAWKEYHDVERAAILFTLAAQLPGAPEFLAKLPQTLAKKEVQDPGQTAQILSRLQQEIEKLKQGQMKSAIR